MMELHEDKRWTIFIKKYPLFIFRAERHNKVMEKDLYNIFVIDRELERDNCMLFENVNLNTVLEIEKTFDKLIKK